MQLFVQTKQTMGFMSKDRFVAIMNLVAKNCVMHHTTDATIVSLDKGCKSFIVHDDGSVKEVDENTCDEKEDD